MRRQYLLWAAICGVLFLVARLSVSLIAIDETRYAGVAWEMWHTGQWLVPHMNGVPYPDKPPLLFWLINLGWWLTGGPSLTWLRLLPALVSFSCLGLVYAMARELWPARPRVARLAPLILGSSLMWALATPLVMFDILLSACVLVAVYGMLILGRAPARGGLLIAAGVALGILAKGPVALLPVAVLLPATPWLLGLGPPWRWWRWALPGVLLGMGIALLWALLAARAGGPAYANAIFWKQTAGRVNDAFAHGRAWWWYLLLLPLLLFPWSGWPALWLAIGRLPFRKSAALRWLAWWLGMTFALFCLISAKQPHYLMPLLPAFALLAAAAVDNAAAADAPARRVVVPGLIMAGLAIAALAIRVTGAGVWPGETGGYPVAAPGVLVALAAGLMLRSQPIVGRTLRLAVCGWLFVVLSIGLFAPAVTALYALDGVAAAVGRMQRAARPVAYACHYEDQFQFFGRLKQPIAQAHDADIQGWVTAHPRAVVVMYCSDDESLRSDIKPLYMSRFRSGWITIRPAAALTRVELGC